MQLKKKPVSHYSLCNLIYTSL